VPNSTEVSARGSYPEQLRDGRRWPGVMRNPEGLDEIRQRFTSEAS
jgi:hypothetical protein